MAGSGCRSFLGLIVVALLACLAPAVSQAGAGHLDRTFGRGGLTSTPPGSAGEEAVVELGVAPGGGTMVGDVADGTFVRFRPNGSWDRSFGKHGRVYLGPATTREGARRRSFGATGMAVDGSGKLVVFGAQTDGREFAADTQSGIPVSGSRAIVLRLGSSGHLDPSFGAGKGFIRGDFGLGSGLETDIPMVTAMVGRVDSEGRPVFVAGVASETVGCIAHSGIATKPRAVVRLTTAGTPDPTFGEGGGISSLEGTSSSPGFELDPLGGSVAAVGRLDGPHPECEPGTALIRLGAQGERASTFGSEGVAVFAGLHLAFVEPSGAIVLSQRKGRTLTVAETKPDGSPEVAFGLVGVAKVRLPFEVRLHVDPVAVDSQGRILLAGFIGSPVASPAKRKQHPSAFVVARLLPDGTIDEGFGDKGWFISRLPAGLEATSAAASLDSDGRLLVAGTVAKPPARAGGFAIARFQLGP